MGWKRDKVVAVLPWKLIQEIDKESREWGPFGRPPGIISLVSDCYKEPKNETELSAHREFVDRGYIALKRGWPDFIVFNKDDLFMVEVKADGDSLRPSQRVVLELIASKGIDVYVRWGSTEPFQYERIGKSKRWVERFVP